MRYARKSSRYVDHIYLYPEIVQNNPVELVKKLKKVGIKPQRIKCGEGMNYLSFENDIYTIDFCRAYAAVFEKRRLTYEQREIIRKLDKTLFKRKSIPISWKYWTGYRKKLLWHDSDFESYKNLKRFLNRMLKRFNPKIQ
jgi:hypothetical protein